METKERLPVIYSNAVRVTMSYYDFMLDFGFNIPTKDPKTEKFVPNIVHIATVAISPQHFKAVVKLANEHLTAYEKQFGEIKIVKPKKTRKRS